jgi:hypothetical protein
MMRLAMNALGHIATIRKAKGRASHFERHPDHTPGVGVERHSVDEGAYRHDAPPISGGSTTGLSATDAWAEPLSVIELTYTCVGVRGSGGLL